MNRYNTHVELDKTFRTSVARGYQWRNAKKPIVMLDTAKMSFGDNADFEIEYVPAIRRKGRSFYIADEKASVEWLKERLQKNGLTNISIDIGPLQQYSVSYNKGKRNSSSFFFRNAKVSASIANKETFTQMVNKGIGKFRCYGFGMLYFKNGEVSYV